MRKITKYGKRIRLLFAGAVAAVGTCIMMLVSWSQGFARADENYYTVLVNGKEVGNVASVSEAEDAFARARIKLENGDSEAVYVDSSMSVVENDAWIGKYEEQSVLEDRIYEELSASLVEVQDPAYVLNVGDASVVLSSLEEIKEVVNTVKDLYDDGNAYQAVITETEDARFGTATCELVQAGIEPVDRPFVMASPEGGDVSENTGETVSFESDIEIVQTYSGGDLAVSVEEAVDIVKSALEVVSVSRETYSETISFTTEYIYNDSQYTDYAAVVQAGQAGERTVTAEITYDNGQETERTVLSSEVVREPVPEIVEVGTMERPAYALPLENAVISDVYGPRWGKMHWGMDFSCRTGTKVLASAGGTVSEAVYRNDYGYTVVIDHGDGMKTRYAHMSQLLVKAGDSVNQGDTVGLSGSTGDSTGPHLHFEMIADGYRINPQEYLYP